MDFADLLGLIETDCPAPAEGEKPEQHTAGREGPSAAAGCDVTCLKSYGKEEVITKVGL